MIFVVSAKSFKKNAKKWLKVRDYIIIDGADSGSIDMDDADKTEIASTYNNVQINGAFTPHHRLTDALKKDLKTDNDGKFSYRTQNLLDDWLNSGEVIAALVAVTKGFTVEISKGAEQRNMFIVLPSKVYRLVGTLLVERFYQVMKADFKFVYPEEEILDSKKILTKDLKGKYMDYLRERIVRVVKKYKLDRD